VKSTLAILFVLAQLGVGCVTPSVPVPPPEPGVVSFSLDASAGTCVVQAALGADWAGGWVVVLADRSGDGDARRVGADGQFTSKPFLAVDGDRVDLEFQTADGQRQGLCLIVHAGPASEMDVCP
jgi:hypothetical protein